MAASMPFSHVAAHGPAAGPVTDHAINGETADATPGAPCFTIAHLATAATVTELQQALRIR
jgi:hypothetical protein